MEKLKAWSYQNLLENKLYYSVNNQKIIRLSLDLAPMVMSAPDCKVTSKKIIELQQEGVSMNKISKTLGIAYGTVYNYRSKMSETEVV